MCSWINLYAVFIYVTLGLCQDNNEATTSTPSITVLSLTDSYPTITWKESDDPSIIVSADDGYQIQVNITQINVNGENDDYVTVRIYREDDEEIDTDEALMFTYTVNGQPSYLFNHNQVRADYIINDDVDKSTNSFEITFSRIGEAATTTPETTTTTTTEAMPTASPEESATLTVYLKNQAAINYEEAQIQALRESISYMGIDYCDDQNCPLNETITSNNVKISLIEPCPLYWENSNICVNLTFGLPIVKSDIVTGSEWNGYQLNKNHLQAMWDTYASKYLNSAGLDIYEEPNVIKIFSAKLIVICVVIVTLVVLILIFRAVILRLNKKRRRHSDTMSIIRQSSSRTSQLSLRPHYLQEVPPLFSNDFQRGMKQPYSDYSPSFTEENDATTPPAPNSVNISTDDPNAMEDADA